MFPSSFRSCAAKTVVVVVAVERHHRSYCCCCCCLLQTEHHRHSFGDWYFVPAACYRHHRYWTPRRNWIRVRIYRRHHLGVQMITKTTKRTRCCSCCCCYFVRNGIFQSIKGWWLRLLMIINSFSFLRIVVAAVIPTPLFILRNH